MKFMVGLPDVEEPPCAGAKLEKYIKLDVRTVDDPSKVTTYGGKKDWWYREGRNHRKENGQIVREFVDEAWFVEINTIEQLWTILEKHKSLRLNARCIISPNYPDIELGDV